MSIHTNIETLIVRLQRREISSSRQAALETAQLLYRFVGAARYSSIEHLLEQIKAVGKRLIAANPKELAVGNILRKILKLIREESKVAFTSYLQSSSSQLSSLGLDLSQLDLSGGNVFDSPHGTISSPSSGVGIVKGTGNANATGPNPGKQRNHSIPGTPMPPTPGIHVPSGHFLSNEFMSKANKPPESSNPFFLSSPKTPTRPTYSTTSSTNTATQTTQPTPTTNSLSNFVQMRHNRAQLERAGSTTNIFGLAIAGGGSGGIPGGGSTGSVTGLGLSELSSMLTPMAIPEDEEFDDGMDEDENENEDEDEPKVAVGTAGVEREAGKRRTSFPGLRFTKQQQQQSSLSSNQDGLPTSFSADIISSSTLTSSPTSTQQPQTPGTSLTKRQQTEYFQILQQHHQTDSERFNKKAMMMKPVLVDAIREVVDEIETTQESCAKGAREHIHSSEIILTVGASKTVEAFLKTAWKDRNFTVIVAETSPSLQGQIQAKNLARHGIPTILVPDSSIFALMPRITKVLFGAHSVLANGGVFTVSGALLAALAAKAHSTPVVVVSGQYKFAPAWNLNHDFEAVEFQSPEGVLNYEEGELLDGVEVANPFLDFVKPDLISLFITNEGDHSPSYIYKIIKEAYDDEDVDL